MSYRTLGIASSSSATGASTTVRLGKSSGDSVVPHVYWTTDNGVDGTHGEWQVYVTPVKGYWSMDNGGKYFQHSTRSYKATGIAEGDPYLGTDGSGKHRWAVSLGDLACASTGETFAEAYNGGNSTWSFSTRQADYLWFRVQVTAVDDNGDKWSTSAYMTFRYVPSYTLSGISYQSGARVKVQYSAVGWERQDDRWCVYGTSKVVVNGTDRDMISGEEPYGEVGSYGGYGFFYVPAASLARSIKGRTCKVEMKFNHAWNASGSNYIDVSGAIACDGTAGCNAPALAASSNGAGGVNVEVSDSGDVGTDNAPDTVTVWLVDSPYEAETVECGVGDTVEFPFVPLGEELTFEAVGYSESEEATSAVGECSYGPIDDGLTRLDGIDGGSSLSMRLRTEGDPRVSVSSAPTYETRHFAGRDRPSAFFQGGATQGAAGEKSISFDGVLVDDPGTGWEDSPFWGLSMLRFPDGRRYPCVCEVSVTGETDRLTAVSVSAKEVDW